MRRRVYAGSLALGAVIAVASLLLLITSASGSDQRQAGAKSTRGGGAVAHMSVTSTTVRRTVLSRTGTVEPGQFDCAVGTCPKKYPTPVSGWFSAKSDKVTLGESVPLGKHKWSVGVVSFDTAPSDYIVGVVCLK